MQTPMKSVPAGQEVARARLAVSLAFVVMGVTLGAWSPQVAVIKQRLDLDDAQLGFYLLILPLAACFGMALATALATRVGTGPLMRLFAPLTPLSLLPPVFAPDPLSTILAFFAFGFTFGALDIAMNAHAALVERHTGRPVMGRFHAWFSAGAFAGAAIASPLTAYAGPTGQAVITVLLTIPVACLAGVWAFSGAQDRGADGAPLIALPGPRIFIFGLIALMALAGEGASLDWSAVWSVSALSLPQSQAAWPFAAFSLGMFIGRYNGDRLRARMSGATILLGGALLWSAGLAVALTSGPLWLVIAGFAVFGLGISMLFPVLIAMAAERTQRNETAAIAAVVSMGYLGVLLGPPIVGFIAQASSLTTALGLVAALGLVVAVTGYR
jgi:predicted MFS family arabinose efflux permease